MLARQELLLSCVKCDKPFEIGRRHVKPNRMYCNKHTCGQVGRYKKRRLEGKSSWCSQYRHENCFSRKCKCNCHGLKKPRIKKETSYYKYRKRGRSSYCSRYKHRKCHNLKCKCKCHPYRFFMDVDWQK